MDLHKKQKIERIRMPDKPYTTQNNAFCFLSGDRQPQKTAGNGLLGKIQEAIKHYGRLYYLLLHVFAPVMPSRQYIRCFRSEVDAYGKEAVVLNLGSGPHHVGGRTDIINVDLYAFPEADIVADATNLPIQSDSVDFIINTAMLEHVQTPEKIINEMHRVLKAGGGFICYVPFMAPFHAAPHDFHRWTIEGAKNYFSIFQNTKTGIGAGPTSGMLWTLQQWLAIAFSFGSKTLHDILFLLLMVITAPIKLLDLLLVYFPNAEKIASGFFITGRK